MTGSWSTPSRRRFLAISAAAFGTALLPAAGRAALPLHRWRGVALGADAEIRIYHADAAVAGDLLARARAEIRRLEAVFSLYQGDSALSRLNRDGRLEAPPLDLVDLLGYARTLHQLSGGAFDPTVQPLWRLYAEHYAGGGSGPAAEAIAATLGCVGFHHVRVAPHEIRLTRPGMALTLNGIAQGFVTDRISDLLHADGLRDILVDLGEIRAHGSDAAGDGWRVGLDPDHSAGAAAERIRLRDGALASSAGLGTTFDAAGHVGHILDPRDGLPVRSGLRGVSVMADRAVVADGLSTAALVCDRAMLGRMLAAYPGARARLVTGEGAGLWLGG
ncbi:FAD:protein FMN transferase [Breoghania sp. L-A4]|uniref:FAD:protein FMN transferase n=1 Tax=Breoghania sp. L-A4 TaxID=2304600 RepID=UPI000E35B18F|nr:FAD:protein FMN transferase [Breoghania sp. L-A4]AXS41401.1 FAD:protein FMN transferase [Breoghania sp. L-A4]